MKSRRLFNLTACLSIGGYLLITFPLKSCKKAVTINSITDQILASQVFSSDQNANAAIAGIYRTLRDNFAGSAVNPTILTGLTGDEVYNFYPDPVWDDYKDNNLRATSYQLPWSTFYNIIYQANLAIEGMDQGHSLSTHARDQYTGEAKFIRALCYFYLINLFGDSPLLLSSQVRGNAMATRTSTTEIYSQITQDLLDAGELMDDDYAFTGGERTRADKWTALALLARVYLYQGNWQDAENLASRVINNSGAYQLLTDLDSFAIKNNPEIILQFANNSTDGNVEAGNFIFSTNPSLLCSDALVSAFEPGDQRRRKWIGSADYEGKTYFYPYKYKMVGNDGNEYYALLRLSELYLIRAEARAFLNDIAGAQADLNTIRNRAGLSNTIANDLSSLQTAIEQERRVELFAETGHRWFDLKRTGRIDNVLGSEKPGWNSLDSLWPIPLSDIQTDPKLIQNPGY